MLYIEVVEHYYSLKISKMDISKTYLDNLSYEAIGAAIEVHKALGSVKDLHPIYEAQIMSYMKLLKLPKGVLINFNVKNTFYDDQKTFVNELYESLTD